MRLLFRHYLIVLFLIVYIVAVWFLLTGKSKICPKIITVQQGGDLGNCVFEYMSLYAVTNLFSNIGLAPYCPNDLREVVEKVFEKITILGKDPKVPDRCYGIIGNYQVPFYASISLNEMMRSTSVTLGVYSARYEDVIKFGVDKIKAELRFRKDHRNVCNAMFNTLKTKLYRNKDNVTYVGMHYRGTDYKHHLSVDYKGYKPPPTYKYYNKAMDYFIKNYENLIFILTTIDYEWLEMNLPFIRKDVPVITNPNGDDAIMDFVLLAHCNHSIISYGTYGVIPALLNEGTTFVYDVNVPLDYKGPAIALAISKLLPNWHVLQ